MIEPERQIEKALRAAAEKRRSEAPKGWSLHPANRRALQAEVARVHGSKSMAKRGLLEGLAGLWPNLGWSFALLIGVSVAAVLMVPSSANRPMSLAQNELRSSNLRRSVVPSQQPATLVQSDALSEAQTASKTSSSSLSSGKLQMTEQTLAARNPQQLGAAQEALSPQPSASSGSLAISGTTAPAEMFRKNYGLGAPAAPQNAPAGASAAPAVAPPLSSTTAFSSSLAGAQVNSVLKTDHSAATTADLAPASGQTSSPTIANYFTKQKAEEGDAAKPTVTDKTALAKGAARPQLALKDAVGVQTEAAMQQKSAPQLRHHRIFQQALKRELSTTNLASI